jgi:hypothetical protein
MATRLTPHFTLVEMSRSNTAVRLDLDNTIPPDLIPNATHVAQALELVREHFGAVVHVSSCYRAPAVNKAVGGSPTSAHRFAHAADFTVEGVPVIEVCQWCALNIPNFDQVIYEFGPGGWCHLGFTNGAPRRQTLTAIKENGKTVYKPAIVQFWG